MACHREGSRRATRSPSFMSFAARTGMLCAMALALMGASGDQNGALRLLTQMRDAAGPVWKAHIVSVSRLAYDDGPAVVSTDSEGYRLRIGHCAGEICDGSYFDGRRLYAVDMNGTAVPVSRQTLPYLRSLRIVTSLEFLSPSFLRDGGSVGAFGSASVEGRKYRTLIVADRDSIPMRLLRRSRHALSFGSRTSSAARTFSSFETIVVPAHSRCPSTCSTTANSSSATTIAPSFHRHSRRRADRSPTSRRRWSP